MALLTADRQIDNLRDAEEVTYTLLNNTTFYKNSFVGKDNTGRLRPFDGTTQTILLGRLVRADNGGFTSAGITFAGKGDDTITSFGGLAGKPTGTAKLGAELIGWAPGGSGVAITGVTTAAASIGLSVFLNGDDNTFTTTAPANFAQAIGIVADVYSAGFGAVLVLPFYARQILNSGENDEWVHIASCPTGATGALGVAASDFGINLPAPYHGTIVDCFEMNNGGALTGGPVTVNPSINGVSTTGGNMVIAVTQPAKTRQAGTAITAANEFHKGDNLSLITSTVTSITAGGPVDFFIRLHRLPGA